MAFVNTGPSRAARRLHSLDIPFLADAVVFGGIAAPVLLMLGLQRMPATTNSNAISVLERNVIAAFAQKISHSRTSRSTVARGKRNAEIAIIAITAGSDAVEERLHDRESIVLRIERRNDNNNQVRWKNKNDSNQ